MYQTLSTLVPEGHVVHKREYTAKKELRAYHNGPLRVSASGYFLF